MNSYERIIGLIKGEKIDRLPIWAARHNKDGFLADTTETMVNREIEFQELYDWDMARISPAAAILVEGFGCTFAGNNHLGLPNVVTRPVNSIDDWVKIKRLDPQEGRYGSIAQATKKLGAYLKSRKLNIATGFSPLTLAIKIAGETVLLETLRNAPDVLKGSLDILADTMIDFINHCIDSGADALYFATQTATFNLITAEEAKIFETPYSIKILNAVKSRLKATILHLHGDNIMIKAFEEYPIDVLNWADKRTIPPVPLSEGKKYFSRTVMGGINGRTTLCTGSSEEIEHEVIDAYKSIGTPFLVSPCCVIPALGVPEENLRVFRNVVNKIAV